MKVSDLNVICNAAISVLESADTNALDFFSRVNLVNLTVVCYLSYGEVFHISQRFDNGVTCIISPDRLSIIYDGECNYVTFDGSLFSYVDLEEDLRSFLGYIDVCLLKWI